MNYKDIQSVVKATREGTYKKQTGISQEEYYEKQREQYGYSNDQIRDALEYATGNANNKDSDAIDNAINLVRQSNNYQKNDVQSGASTFKLSTPSVGINIRTKEQDNLHNMNSYANLADGVFDNINGVMTSNAKYKEGIAKERLVNNFGYSKEEAQGIVDKWGNYQSGKEIYDSENFNANDVLDRYYTQNQKGQSFTEKRNLANDKQELLSSGSYDRAVVENVNSKIDAYNNKNNTNVDINKLLKTAFASEDADEARERYENVSAYDTSAASAMANSYGYYNSAKKTALEVLKKAGIDEQTARRYYEKQILEKEQMAEDKAYVENNNSFQTSASSVILKPFESVRNVTENAINYVKGNPIETKYENKRSDQIRENVMDKEDMGGVGRFLYGAAMSGADQLPAFALSAVTGGAAATIILGLEKASSDIDNAVQRGLNPTQIMVRAGMGGVATAITKGIAFNRIADIFNGKYAGDTFFKQIAKAATDGFVSEGLQESSEDVADAIFDKLIAGNKSDLNMQAQELIRNGMDEEEAYRSVMMNFVVQCALDGLAGGLTGAVFGGGANIVGNTARYANNLKTVSEYETGVSALRDAKRLSEIQMSNENARTNAENDIAEKLIKNDFTADEAIKTAKEITDKVYGDYVTYNENTDTKLNDIVKEAVEENETTETKAEENTQPKTKEQIISEVTDEYVKEQKQRVEDKIASYEQKDEQKLQKAIDKKIDKNGADINQITNIKETKNGIEFTVDGKKISGKDLLIKNAETSSVLKNAINIADTLKVSTNADRLASIYVNQYKDSSMNPDQFNIVFKNAFVGARAGLDLDTVINNIPMDVDASVVESAYNASKNFADYVVKQNVSDAQTQIVKMFSDNVGVNIVFGNDESITDVEREMLKTSNGFYSNGRLVLSDTAENPLSVVAAHELVHYMKDTNEEAYNSIREVGSKFLGTTQDYEYIKKNKEREYADQIAEYRKQGKSEEFINDFIDEEINASITEAMMEKIASMNKDEAKSFAKEFVRENEGIVKAFVDFLNDFIKKIDKALKGYRATDEAAKVMLKNKDQLEMFTKTFMEALNDTKLKNGREEFNDVEVEGDYEFSKKFKISDADLIKENPKIVSNTYKENIPILQNGYVDFDALEDTIFSQCEVVSKSGINEYYVKNGIDKIAINDDSFKHGLFDSNETYLDYSPSKKDNISIAAYVPELLKDAKKIAEIDPNYKHKHGANVYFAITNIDDGNSTEEYACRFVVEKLDNGYNFLDEGITNRLYSVNAKKIHSAFRLGFTQVSKFSGFSSPSNLYDFVSNVNSLFSDDISKQIDSLISDYNDRDIERKNVVNKLYNDATITFEFDQRFKELIIDNNKENLVESLRKGYFESFVDRIVEQTNYTKEQVWSELSDLTYDKNGIAKSDGKTYVNIHELSVNNLLKSIELGGLVAPSMAIVDVDNPNTNFGEVTLIFPSYIVNPASDPIFYGDAYSTSFPAVAKFSNEEKLSMDFIGKYDEILNEEEMYNLLSEIEDYSWYDNSQRTSSRISDISFDGISNLAKDYGFRSIPELIKLYESKVDGFENYTDFLNYFVETYFDVNRIHKDNTYNSDYDYGSVRHNQFRYYSLDDALEEMTARGEKDFEISTGERIKSNNELLSKSARSQLKGKTSYQYYEAKPQRIIDIGDASYAVIPYGNKKLARELRSLGVDVKYYSTRTEADGKNEVIGNILETDSNIRYSKKSTTTDTSFENTSRATRADSILRKGFNIVGYETPAPESIRKIASTIISEEDSNYKIKDLATNLQAVFAYIEKYKKNANWNDMMRITYDVCMPVIKNSEKMTTEAKSERAFDLALRVYQEYFTMQGGKKQAGEIQKARDEVAKKYKDMMANAKERREMSDVREQIYKKKTRLDRMLTHPTKGSHIPKELVRAAAQIADAVDVRGKRQSYRAADKAQELRNIYSEIEKNEAYNFAYDEQISRWIADLQTILENKNVRSLTMDELNKVNDILNGIITRISNENKVLSIVTSETISELSEKGTQEVRSIKQRKDNFGNKANNLLQNYMLNFESLMDRTFGYKENSVGRMISGILKDAELAYYTDKFELENLFKDVVSGDTKEAKEANAKNMLRLVGKNSKGKYDESTWVTIPSFNGSEEIKVPASFRLSMIMHMLGNDNLRHVAYGGFSLPNFNEYKKDNVKGAYERSTKYVIPFFNDAEVENAKKMSDAFAKYNEETERYEVNKEHPLYKNYQKLLDEKNSYTGADIKAKYEDDFDRLYADKRNAKTTNDKQAISNEIKKLREKRDAEIEARRDELDQIATDAWNEYQKEWKNADRILDDLIEARRDEFLKILTKDLTDHEKAFLESAKKFFWEESAKKMNETSQSLYGYNKATVDKYFPIHVDSDLVTGDTNIKRDGTIEGKGFTKERVKSKKAIYLEDIVNVIQRHEEDIAKYHGYARAVRDANSILHYNVDGNESLAKTIKNKWTGAKIGKNYVDAYSILDNTLSDIQSNWRQESTLDTWANTARGNFAAATLTGNLGVSIKQSASYPTAAAEIGWKALGQTFKDFGKKGGIKEVEERTPLMHVRELGLSTQELSEAKNLKLNKLTNNVFTNMIQGVDVYTVHRLEYAAMHWVDENTDLEKGTDEYWDAVTDKFNETVRKTQPNYTLLERPELLKEKGFIAKTLSMFKTQPIQNYRILHDAISEYSVRSEEAKLDKSESAQIAKDKAGKKLANAISSNIVSAVLYSAMTQLAKGVYHQFDDDDDEQKWYLQMLNTILSSEAGMIPFGSELYSLLIGSKVFGDTYYGFSNPSLETLNNITDGVSGFWNALQNVVEGAETETDDEKRKRKLAYELRKMSFSIASAFGIPANNMYKIVNSAYSYIDDAFNKDLGSSNGLLTYKWVNDVDKMGKKMYDAVLSGDIDRYNKLKNELGGKEDKFVTEVKNQFTDGNITKEEAMQIFISAGWHEKVAEDKVNPWMTDESNEQISDYIESVLTEESVDDTVKEEIVESVGDESLVNKNIIEQTKEKYLAKEIGLEEAAKVLVETTYDDTPYDTINDWVESQYSNEIGHATDALVKKDYDTYEKYVSDLKEAGMTEEGIQKRMKEFLKYSIQNGRTGGQNVEYILKDKFGMDENEAYFQRIKWTYPQEDGKSDTEYGYVYSSIDSGNIERIKTSVTEMSDHGKEKSGMSKAVTNRYKQTYIDASAEERKELYKILKEAYMAMGYTESEVKKKINEWVK